MELGEQPREHLTKYLYFELSAPAKNRTNGLAGKLFYYLKNTETNDNRLDFLKTLEWAADLQKTKPRTVSMKEICQLEAKVARIPAGKKETRK